MYYKTKFNAFDEEHDFVLDTETIDRNNDDESYAYWVVDHNGHYFEVNIWKDENGNFTDNGKVYCFNDYETFVDAGDANEECDITFRIATTFDRAVAFLQENIYGQAIYEEWERLDKWRSGLSNYMRNKICDLLDEFSCDNDLPDDWWYECYDEMDFFDAL